MSELKTLKDLMIELYESDRCNCNDIMKQEAIKWWIFKHGRGEDVCCTCEEIWREFFNITEEDLKDE